MKHITKGAVATVFCLSLLSPQMTHAATHSTSVKPHKVTKKQSTYCSCVTYAKAASGINVGSIGYAKNHPINTKKPKVGAIVVMYSGNTGHLGVVRAVGKTTITITEANYKPCAKSTRTLSKSSKTIRGYYVKTLRNQTEAI